MMTSFIVKPSYQSVSFTAEKNPFFFFLVEWVLHFMHGHHFRKQQRNDYMFSPISPLPHIPNNNNNQKFKKKKSLLLKTFIYKTWYVLIQQQIWIFTIGLVVLYTLCEQGLRHFKPIWRICMLVMGRFQKFFPVSIQLLSLIPILKSSEK